MRLVPKKCGVVATCTQSRCYFLVAPPQQPPTNRDREPRHDDQEQLIQFIVRRQGQFLQGLREQRDARRARVAS